MIDQMVAGQKPRQIEARGLGATPSRERKGVAISDASPEWQGAATVLVVGGRKQLGRTHDCKGRASAPQSRFIDMCASSRRTIPPGCELSLTRDAV